MSQYKESDVNRGCRFSINSEGEHTVCRRTGGYKLDTYDWMSRIDPREKGRIFEVRFKNTRKGFFENDGNLSLKVGDIVTVEGTPGHDVGIISLSGEMVEAQMRAKRFRPENAEFKKIFRLAKPSDIAKWQEAISKEYDTMIRARQIAASLELNMKIGDVEYQGDGMKAIFYYIADVRVDFRELIKIFAEQFRVRIEMKQIGARQEAGRIGGIGACGRELCCSTWVTNFVSVTTNSARFQDIVLNPQKLAGQCSKLKCCLNYEVDSYIDARKGFPKLTGPLETVEGSFFLFKTDILKKEMTFSSDPHMAANTVTLPVSRVKEIIAANRKGVKVERLLTDELAAANSAPEEPDYKNVVGDESITRFDKEKNKSRNRRSRGGKGRGKGNGDNDTKESAAPKQENKGSKPEKGEATSQAPREGEPRKSNRNNRHRRNRNNNNRNNNNGGSDKPSE